jgi:hypothetical protein
MGKLASAPRFHTINPIYQFTYILQDPLSSGAELKISIAVNLIVPGQNKFISSSFDKLDNKLFQCLDIHYINDYCYHTINIQECAEERICNILEQPGRSHLVGSMTCN